MGKRSYSRKCEGVGVQRWNVSKLLERSKDTQDKESTRERYLRSVEEKLKEAWDGNSCVEKKWEA